MEDMEAVWVDMVRSVVTPRATLAGTACTNYNLFTVYNKHKKMILKKGSLTLGSSQKLTQETMTSIQPGM